MKLMIHDKKLLMEIDNSLFTGWAPATEHAIIEGPPKFKWKGAKIPFQIWTELVCFLRWTQESFKEEAMVTLFYHPENREWAAWAFPQEPCGMTIKLLPDMEQYKADRQKFGKGWIQAGSVHHHCTSAAFASSTDQNDEMDRDGVHITLGHLDKEVLDTHIRQVFDGVVSLPYLIDWIEVPEFIKNAPEWIKWETTAYAIKAVRNMDFPAEWKERIYEKPKHQGTPNFHNGNHHPAYDPRTGSKATMTLLGSSNNGHGKVTTESKKTLTLTSLRGKKGNISVGSIAAKASGSGNWDEICSKVLVESILNLGLTVHEAWTYLAFDNEGKTMEEAALNQALRNDVHRAGIPILHAEKLVYALVEEERQQQLSNEQSVVF